jgi:hypothetical protein
MLDVVHRRLPRVNFHHIHIEHPKQARYVIDPHPHAGLTLALLDFHLVDRLGDRRQWTLVEERQPVDMAHQGEGASGEILERTLAD